MRGNTPGSLFFSRIFFEEKGILTETQVESYRFYKNFCITQLKGINSISQAQGYVGKDVFVHEEDLFPLDKDQYYLHQIIGFDVTTKSDEVMGRVKDALFVPGNELLVIEKAGKEFYIPFAQSICLEIDHKTKKIVIDPPEGLLDLNEI